MSIGLGRLMLVNILVSQIVEHIEINEHLEKIAENLMVEHCFTHIYIATNDRSPGIFPLH